MDKKTAKKTIQVTIGEKIIGNYDKSKAVKTHPLPPPVKDTEVGGRETIYHYPSICPHCGTLGYIDYDTENYHIYTCHWCGYDYCA